MSAEESERVLKVVSGKYERNPLIGNSAPKKLLWTKRRRDWETRGLYPESGQPLMESFVAPWRPQEA
jgi:ribosomal protein L24E